MLSSKFKFLCCRTRVGGSKFVVDTLVRQFSGSADDLKVDSDLAVKPVKRINALDKVDERTVAIVNQIRPVLRKSFNLAAYVNSSATLQELLKLSVNLSAIDKHVDLASYIVRADFDTDIAPHIRFLLDRGVNISEVGRVINRNPFLLVIPLEDLETRIAYFEFRKFTKSQIATILLRASNILSFDTKTLDSRLATLCREYELSASELRHVVVSYPRIIELRELQVKQCSFAFTEEMGFSPQEIKSILLQYPILWRKFFKYTGHEDFVRIFDFLHTEMGVSHEQISQSPQIFTRRLSLLRPRHAYLKKLGRAQYDPKAPLYVPLSAFYALDDGEFCVRYAKTSSDDFNAFLKTQ